MIQTQLLQLQPPYQVIYCGGEVGLHVATLIVVDELRDEAGRYMGIRTYSHPVVSYTNKLRGAGRPVHPLLETGEGVVWNRAELKDVSPLCLATDEEVALERLNWLRYEYYNPAGSTSELPPLGRIASRLRDLGFAIGLPGRQEMEQPQMLVYMPGQHQPYVYATSKTAVFYTPWASVEKMADRLRQQQWDYEHLYLPGEPPHITFCIDKEESFCDFYCAEEAGTLDEQYMAIDPEIREGMEQLVQRLNSGIAFPF